jgi:hypothetical protein
MTTAYLPGVVRARYISDYVIQVHFDDGTVKRVDMSQWFKGPVFEPLKRKPYFRKLFIEGATVAWPNGVDISPEALYAAEDRRKTSRRHARIAPVARRVETHSHARREG